MKPFTKTQLSKGIKCKCGWKLAVLLGGDHIPLVIKCGNKDCEFRWEAISGVDWEYAMKEWPTLAAPVWYMELAKKHPGKDPIKSELTDIRNRKNSK